MGSTFEAALKDYESSSGDECTHERLAAHRHSISGEFWCKDCLTWTTCPHTSWRWTTDLKTRKICNWCGHQWVDKEKQDAALLEAQQLEAINAHSDIQFVSVQAFRDFTSNGTGPCAHVAWDVKSQFATVNGWYEYRKCTDCGIEWQDVSDPPEPALTPAQDEIASNDEGREFYGETEQQPRMPDFGRIDLTGTTRAPMLGVAYAVGGKLYEILVHEDAQVVAEDGVLKVSHLGPIHGIVAVRPVFVPDPAGEEQST